MLNKNILFYFIFAIVLISPVHSLWAETNVAQKYGCKNLHEIQSGEDALKQLYDNLNTDCFAKITEIELEKVWGIKVYDIAKIKKMNNEEFSKYSDNKPIFKGKMVDKLFAELKDKNIANLKLRIKGVSKLYGYEINSSPHSFDDMNILIYNDRFPKNLPVPIIDCEPPRRTYQRIGDISFRLTNYGVYSAVCDYFWQSNDRNKKIVLDVVHPDKEHRYAQGGIPAFEFYINAD